MTDWDAITRTWVEDGIIAEDQRDAVLGRLRAVPAPSAASPLPLGPIVTALVAGAVWMLTGALMAFILLIDLQEVEHLVSGVLIAAGCGSAVVGLAARPFPRLLAISRGFVAAAPPVVALGCVSLVTDAPWVAVCILPALAGIAVAVLGGSRATAATSSLTLAWTVMLTMMSLAQANIWANLLVPATGVAIAVAAAASRLVEVRRGALGVLIPGLVMLMTASLFSTDVHFPPVWRSVGMGSEAQLLEKFFELLLVAGAVVLAGALARSPWALVPGLLLIGISTIGVASLVGSWLGGTIALVLVGGAFLVAAIGMVAVRGAQAA